MTLQTRWVRERLGETSVDYDQTDIAQYYDRARTLTPEAMTTSLDAMMDVIAPERVRVILDIGCGMGRFAVPLHTRFGARVVGLDPSRHMLAHARQTIQPPAMQFLHAAAECLPLQGACADLAYLSMVYHHLHDATRSRPSCFAVRETRGWCSKCC